MLLRFSKMHGLGNDFVILDLISQRYKPKASDMQKIADRNLGVGCDQILLIEPPEFPENDFKYRIFNADGGEVEQCGNGARCFAKYVRDKGLIGKNNILVETQKDVIALQINDDGITVDMGPPHFEPSSLPFIAENQQQHYPLDVNGTSYSIGAISMGNPHAVLLVDNTKTTDVGTLGPLIESHERFPNRVNAGFLQVVDQHNGKLRVYERGAGETLACGTGACAAAVYGIQQGLFKSPVNIDLPGGSLSIEYTGGTSHVLMTGPATFVFEGKIRL